MSKSLKKLIDINRLREFKNKLVGTDSAYVQTAAVDQTIAGTKTFSKPIVGSVTGSSGSCTGNSATATKATQDAAGNTITTTYATKAENNTKANNSEVVHKSGDETIAGTKTFSNGVLATTLNAFMAQSGGYTLLIRIDSKNAYLLMSDKDGVPGSFSSARPLTISNSTGVCDINGNASTATTAATAAKLATTRAINGTNFDGSAAITTANWGTARNIYVADSDGTNTGAAVSVNGSANATLKLPATIKASITGNCSGSSGSCTGNSATATKLAAKRTIALSGAATGTATGFDGSGNITIPVTALASSAIRAQWYAAYPDGAEAHNAMWGGRDITAAFNAGTVSASIVNGTFRDIFPGDYITKSVTIPQVLADDGITVLFTGGTYTVNWVIADCDYWINKGHETAITAHHVAIVPMDIIFDAHMNPVNTTEGGYAGSEMYKNIIPACATGIVNAFGSDHILTFGDTITREVNTSSISSGTPFWTGASSDWGWYDAQCNLMCERMVYGMPAFSSSAWDAGVATRQFSAFRLSERLINYNRHHWWLRDVVSSALFAGVHGGGHAYSAGASDVLGVRPFALLV